MKIIKKLMTMSDHNLRSIMILCFMVLGLTISLTTEPTFWRVIIGFLVGNRNYIVEHRTVIRKEKQWKQTQTFFSA